MAKWARIEDGVVREIIAFDPTGRFGPPLVFVAAPDDVAEGKLYGDSATFLDVLSYKNVQRWTAQIAARPAVKRGRIVNRTSGDPASQLHERHDASDFATRTQDKLVKQG